MRILVVGGTGVVGRLLVSELIDRGHAVNVLSRRGGSPDPRAEPFAGDLGTGAGVAAAVDGVDTVVDVAHVATARRAAAVRYFTTSTATVGRLAATAGATHHVVLGIVGSDLVPFGYYRGKVAQERAVLDGPLPATILRATQFHEFVGQNLTRMRIGRLALLPGMRIQPVAAVEVAAALADLAVRPAAGRVPDLAGPREEWLPDLARALVRRDRLRTTVWTMPVPGAAGRAVRGGSLLAGPDARRRGPSFARWLSA